MAEWECSIDFDRLSDSIYAQGAEEAMLDHIFERIEPGNRFCVEFGAGDGLRNSNSARLLRESGWKAQVASIAQANNFVYVSDVVEGPVADWVLQSGLTQESRPCRQARYWP